MVSHGMLCTQQELNICLFTRDTIFLTSHKGRKEADLHGFISEIPKPMAHRLNPVSKHVIFGLHRVMFLFFVFFN